MGLRKRRGFPIVGCSLCAIEAVAADLQITKQTQCMGGKAWLVLRRFERAASKPLRVVEPIQQQISAAQGGIGPATMLADPRGSLIFEKLLCLQDSVQR